MKQLPKLIFFVLITTVIFYCKKPKTQSDVPEISFKAITITDSTDALGNEEKKIYLTFQVIDGDGDIGLKEDDTLKLFKPLGNKNLFINLYEKIDGEYVKVDLKLPHDYRTPFLELIGQQKLLKADIEVSIEYSKLLFDYDTIKYDFYLYDRELHKSNLVETPEIPANEIGTITEEK